MYGMSTINYKEEFNKFIPGFSMGVTRAIISHPFEMFRQYLFAELF